MKQAILLLLLSLGLAGCSSLPKSIRDSPAKELSLIEATADKSIGTNIRWGGEVVRVENKNAQSLLEIVAYPLNHYGKPQTGKDSQGRYVARSEEFYDPEVYEKGTLITIVGRVAGAEKRKVDQRSLLMPVIDITESHKWRPTQQRHYQDPFYDPFYSPYYYPYRGFYGSYWRHPRFGYRYYHH